MLLRVYLYPKKDIFPGVKPCSINPSSVGRISVHQDPTGKPGYRTLCYSFIHASQVPWDSIHDNKINGGLWWPSNLKQEGRIFNI